MKPITSIIERSLSRNIDSSPRKDNTNLYLQQLSSRKKLSNTVSQSKLLRSSPLRKVFDSSYVSHISSITPEPSSKLGESIGNSSYL
jgi:hypothetical protein